jgi:hypothetical protein
MLRLHDDATGKDHMIESDRGGKFTGRGFLASAAILAGAPLVLSARRAFALAHPESSPPEVLMAEFMDTGEKIGVSRVPKVVKPDGRASGSRSPRKMSAGETGRPQAPVTPRSPVSAVTPTSETCSTTDRGRQGCGTASTPWPCVS